MVREIQRRFLEPPGQIRIDTPTWTLAFAQQYLGVSFDVEYSIPSCRRLLKEAGLSYQKSHRSAVTSCDGLPFGLVGLNSVSECRRQLQAALSSTFFSLDELTTAIDTALDQRLLQSVSNYF